MSNSNRDVGEPDIKPTATELREAMGEASTEGRRRSTRKRRRRRHHDETSDDDKDQSQYDPDDETSEDDEYQPQLQPPTHQRHAEESSDDDDYQYKSKPKRRRHQRRSNDGEVQHSARPPAQQQQFFTYESGATGPNSLSNAGTTGPKSSRNTGVTDPKSSSNEFEAVEQKPPLNFWKQKEEVLISNPINLKKWKEGNEELTKVFNYLRETHREKGRLSLTTIKTVFSSMTPEVLQKIKLPFFERNWDIRKMQLKKDEVGNKILKSFMDCGLETYESSTDGNCLYNSLSISLYGHERYALHMRFQTLKFFVDNYDHIKSMKDNEFFWTEGIDTSLSKCARLGCHSDVAAIYCAARALSVTIRLVYPPINGFLDDWFLRVPKFFEPITQPMAEVYLMWSSNTTRHVGYFKPDHFLPAFRNHLDSSRKVIDLSQLENSFSTFVSNHTVSGGAMGTSDNDSSDQDTDVSDEIEQERYRALECSENGQTIIDCSLDTGVSPYSPISGTKEKIRYILEHPNVYVYIPECEKSDCQFIVRDTDSNKKFDDHVGQGWERLERTANRFFDKSNNEFVSPSISDDHEYEYKRRELISQIPSEENVLHFYESNYIHKENPNFMRKIFVVGSLCFFQYIGSLDKKRDYMKSYTPIKDDVEIIKYVLAFEPKSPHIPSGSKENCQFVVIDGNEKKTFTDKIHSWKRLNRSSDKYFDQNNDYQPIKTNLVAGYTNVVKLHSFKHRYNQTDYYRDIHVVNDFVFFQYYGTPPDQVRDMFKESLATKSRQRRPSIKKKGQMLLNVPQVALKMLTSNNRDIDLNDLNSYGIYYSPGPQLTNCEWKHEKGHKCAIKVTRRNGRKQCQFTKERGPHVRKVSHNIYYCECNPDIQREVFIMAQKVLVKFFGTSPKECTCDPEKSYENLKAIVLKNLKVPTASIYMAHKDKFRNETQISNIKAKLNQEIHAVRNGLSVPTRKQPQANRDRAREKAKAASTSNSSQ